MFVQLNPDATSFSETLSTLKFAERVSGVELGAAKSSRDSKEVRELTDQVICLHTITTIDPHIFSLLEFFLKHETAINSDVHVKLPDGSF